MKIVTAEGTVEHANGPTCTAFEYPMGSKALSIARVVVHGRYPEQGFVSNSQCAELVYVLAGSGKITLRGTWHGLAANDAILIEPNERYWFQGKGLELLITNHPAWTPEQHHTHEV